MKWLIRHISSDDSPWIEEIVRGWGADFIVSRGRKLYPDKLPGYVAEDTNDRRVGLATFELIGDQCELVTLDAFEKWQGIGTALLERVRQSALEAGCRRLWLITTNDNLDAIRFYQRRGFTFAAVHAGALEISRRIKPSIPITGNFGIPLTDEIEFEIRLPCADQPPTESSGT
jgi:N-acetylglutamate synthase-like GNAT family acetyltransferase